MLTFMFMIACGEKDSDTGTVENEFDVLAEFASQLSGAFDSSAQASENPQYYDVSLQACQIEVDGLDGITLYVEQALSDQLDSPYRQRVYQLTQINKSEVRSEIFELLRPVGMIGHCSEISELELSTDDIVLKEGCAVELEWNGKGFDGQTAIGTCLSDMNGATYATSVVETSPEMISSWDQGWDSNDEQVWGAEDGPYIFIRQQ